LRAEIAASKKDFTKSKQLMLAGIKRWNGGDMGSWMKFETESYCDFLRSIGQSDIARDFLAKRSS
jgi:hypothetical protein